MGAYMYIYDSTALCLFFVLIISYLFFKEHTEQNKINRYFKLLLFLALAHLCFDLASIYTITHMDKVPYILNRSVHQFAVGFILSMFVNAYLFLSALIETELRQKIQKNLYIYVPFAAASIGIMFLPIYYNATEGYAYGPGIYVIYIAILFFVALTGISMLKYRSIISKRNMTAMKITFVVEFIVFSLSFLMPGLRASNFGVSIIVLTFYLIAENPDAILVQKLLEANKQADAANQAKTEFLAHMSHEIRTPINAVLGMNEMILRESKEPEIAGYAKEVKSAAHSLLGIINDILDITKIESGKLELNPVRYKLKNLLSDIHNMIYFRAQEKGLHFQMILDEKLPRVLYGDDIRVRQILINLLTNAVKYTQSGSVTMEVKLYDENTLFFSVNDTGMGIKTEDLDKLFIPFERIEEMQNRNIEGTGLGLNITKQLLLLHGSELTIKSEYGSGSEFSFMLKQEVIDNTPFQMSLRKEPSGKITKQYTPLLELPDARILVVDDNKMNRLVMKQLLKATQAHIDEAESGFACLESTRQQRYDLILMDHMMPEMDGIETFEKIRADKENLCNTTPVVIVTANALVGDKEKYLNIGFNGYLSKPVNAETLEKALWKTFRK